MEECGLEEFSHLSLGMIWQSFIEELEFLSAAIPTNVDRTYRTEFLILFWFFVYS